MQGNGDETTPRRARQTLPEDRFDRLEKSHRVGAHRIAARPRRFWLYLLAAVVGVVILTTVGIVAMQAMNTSSGGFSNSEAEQPAAPEQLRGEIDPEATVVILNGTETPNLQAGVDQVITENGWGQIAFSDYAASREVQISAVFYSAPEDEVAAAGLAQELGGVSYYQSSDYDQYGVRLVVLLGADYAGPGFDAAATITARMQDSEDPADSAAQPEE